MPKQSLTLEGVDAATVRKWLTHETALLIDIREDHEFAAEHIAEAHQIALSEFDAAELPDIAGKVVVFHCAGGKRTTNFADELATAAASAKEIYQMDGGIEAWKAAGLPTLTKPTVSRSGPGTGNHITAAGCAA